MNRLIRKAVVLSLTGGTLVGIHTECAAIDITAPIVVDGGPAVTGTAPVYAWDGQNGGPSNVWGGNSQNLGWAHNSVWRVVRIRTSGVYNITLKRTSNEQFHPAFTLWATGDKPFDDQAYIKAGYSTPPGTHSYNQVRLTPKNASAWMTGTALGKTWKPSVGKSAVKSLVGYTNSGVGFTNGTPGNPSKDRDKVIGGGGRAVSGQAVAPLGQGSASLQGVNLQAGYYLMALGGSCNGGDSASKPHTECGSLPGNYSLQITPEPVPANCTRQNDAPTLDVIAPRWNAAVGKEMQFTVTALDACEDDVIKIKATGLPPGARIASQGFDANHKWAAVIKYKASPAQAGKQFAVNFQASESQAGGKSSKPVRTFIRVLPNNGQPLPVPPNCTQQNDPPSLDLLATPWNADVGKEIQFKVSAVDACDNDAITIKPIGLPAGASIASQGLANGKRTAVVRFTPRANQANQYPSMGFQAVETKQGGKSSATGKTFIRVWPASTTPATYPVQEIAVYRAQWVAPSKMEVAGRVIFSKKLTPQQLADLPNNKLQITDGTNPLGEANVKASGDWSVILNGLDGTQVPCSIVVEFDTKKAWRDVRKLPAQGCKKE